MLDQLQPGWREVVIERRFLPRMVAASALATAADGGLAGRPGPQVPEAPGLYLAGDWVGPQGWLADASPGERPSRGGARAGARAASGTPRPREHDRLARRRRACSVARSRLTSGLLWNLCYRMTGIAADADDLRAGDVPARDRAARRRDTRRARCGRGSCASP